MIQVPKLHSRKAVPIQNFLPQVEGNSSFIKILWKFYNTILGLPLFLENWKGEKGAKEIREERLHIKLKMQSGKKTLKDQ